MRVASVDLGTNTTRLLVADVEHETLAEVARRTVITRMGEAVDERGSLLPTAVARVHEVLGDYRREADTLGAERVLAVATSAVRDAANGISCLREIESRYGFTSRLLSGQEEAALTLRGVTSDRVAPPGTLLVDIGGGSTELVVTGAERAFQVSLQIGSVRLTERFLRSDPPTAAELEACAAHVRSALPELEPVAAIGVAGTITSAAWLDLGTLPYDPALTHAHRLQRAAVEREIGMLVAIPLAERERVPCLEPARAPVIVAGLVILREILAAYGLDEIEVSERDILHGAALAAAEQPTAAGVQELPTRPEAKGRGVTPVE